MDIVVVPGVNGLGNTSGVESSFETIVKDYSFKTIDLPVGDISKQLKIISKQSKNYFSTNKCFFLGGDHSISYPLVLEFFKKYGKESNLLIFDAHPDLMQPLEEPSHEEWLRAIIEKGFPKENILIVGIRRESKNIDSSELSYIENKGIQVIFSDEVKDNHERILQFAQRGPLYVSFDIDVFDSSIVSCTGYPEKEGLFEDSFFPILEKICVDEGPFYFDLVEVNLEKKPLFETDKTLSLSRKILKTVISE